MGNESFVGGWKGVVGRRKGLSNLYDSDKWEFGCKSYGIRSWKNYRANKFKKNFPSFKALQLVEAE